jgi:hypothetical protein
MEVCASVLGRSSTFSEQHAPSLFTEENIFMGIHRVTLLVMVVFAGAATTLTMAPTPSTIAQDRDDLQAIEKIVQHAPQDEMTMEYTRRTFDTLRSFVSASRAETVEELRNEANKIGLGIPILDQILDFSFGGHKSSTNFRMWREAFVNSNYHSLQNAEALRVTIKKISPALMEVLRDYAKHPPQDVVYLWIEPRSTDSEVFTVRVKYLGARAGETVRILNFNVTPAEAVRIDPDQGRLLQSGQQLCQHAKSIDLRRLRPVGLTITVNTERGSATISIPSRANADGQRMQRLESENRQLAAQVTELSRRVAQLEGKEFLAWQKVYGDIESEYWIQPGIGRAGEIQKLPDGRMLIKFLVGPRKGTSMVAHWQGVNTLFIKDANICVTVLSSRLLYFHDGVTIWLR